MKETPLYQNPDYVQGQIESLRSLVLALAQSVPEQEFREQGLERLEALRVAMLSMPVEETRLLAVDDTEKWLKTVTS